jgi:hypothetical protein
VASCKAICLDAAVLLRLSSGSRTKGEEGHYVLRGCM